MVRHAGLFGIVEAARLLGMHRSTLHIAIQHGEITPDTSTRKGHVRFSMATLEAYRAHLREGPAASGARPQLLRRLAGELAHDSDVPELARLALTGLRKLSPGFVAGLVYAYRPTSENPWKMTALALEGISEADTQPFVTLRRNTEFAFMTVLRDGVVVRCRDAATDTVVPGTRAFLDYVNAKSFILLPITYTTQVAGPQVLGMLGVGFAEPRAFGSQEEQFYAHIADVLGVAIRMRREKLQYHGYLKAANDLMLDGLTHNAAPSDASVQGIGRMLLAMAETYRRATGAFTVICTSGPLAPGMVEDEQVRALAEACILSGPRGPKRWILDGKQASGVGVHVPLPDGMSVGIAAGWTELRKDWDEDVFLLQVMAGACVLGLPRG